MKHVVKILESYFITHDVKYFKVQRPKGYRFIPGQATEVSINKPSWENKLRPFTFTNLPTKRHLEFMIKVYRDHPGVTNELGKTNSGGELIIHEVFGAIQYKGPGIFIAAGSGITPFIPIFRSLFAQKKLKGHRLIYSNKTVEDIILGQELLQMLKTDFINVITRQNQIGFVGKRIDRRFLIETIVDFNQHFYVCGPENFVKSITKDLLELGVTPNSLIVEE